MKKGIDYIGVGAGAVILSPEGKVFLARRGKEAGKRDPANGNSPAAVSSSMKRSSMPWFAR